METVFTHGALPLHLYFMEIYIGSLETASLCNSGFSGTHCAAQINPDPAAILLLQPLNARIAIVNPNPL